MWGDTSIQKRCLSCKRPQFRSLDAIIDLWYNMLAIVAQALALVLGCQVNGDSFSLTVKSPTQVTLQESDIWQALETIQQPDFFPPSE